MDLARRKRNILEQLSLISDEGLLARIQAYIDAQIGSDELTRAELDELVAQEAERLRGDVRMCGREEAMRMMRYWSIRSGTAAEG